jgi:hypothetical protein
MSPYLDRPLRSPAAAAAEISANARRRLVGSRGNPSEHRRTLTAALRALVDAETLRMDGGAR